MEMLFASLFSIQKFIILSLNADNNLGEGFWINFHYYSLMDPYDIESFFLSQIIRNLEWKRIGLLLLSNDNAFF